MKKLIDKTNSKLLTGLLLLIVLSLISSCRKEWLEKKANKNQSIPETLKDYQALLNNDIGGINVWAPALIEVASDGHFTTESAWSSALPNERNAYTWTQSTPYNEFYAWNYIYSRLYYPNFVLDGLKTFKTSNDTESKQLNEIRAQALFLKAESYYLLSQHYAQPYSPNSAANDQGIVVQESSDFMKPVSRVSAKETYDLILGYLKEAVEYLPATPKILTQASSSAAYALLARTCLVMQDYTGALEYSDKSLQLKNTLIDFSGLSLTSGFIGKFNMEVLFHDEFYTSELSGFITSACLIDPVLYNSYDNNDLRKSAFFNKAGDNITFKGNYNNNPSSLFCGIAVDEVFLIRAECYARKGNTTAAMKDLNDLLKTRWKKQNGISTYVDQTAINADDALIKILDERKKELLLRGLRWSDLRRLNMEDRFKVTLSRTIGGKTYILEPNSYKYTFPIPLNILEKAHVPQTTGW